MKKIKFYLHILIKYINFAQLLYKVRKRSNCSLIVSC